jgi:hypothetical protein
MPSYAPTTLMIDDRGLAESFRRRGCGIVAVLQGAPDSGIKVNLNTFASTSTKSATQSSSLTSFIYHGYKTTKKSISFKLAKMSRTYCIPGVFFLFSAWFLLVLVSISLPSFQAMDITRVHSSGQVAGGSNEAFTQFRVSGRLVESRCPNSWFLIVPPSSAFGR